MNISAKDIGKKYGKNWIFRDLSFDIPSQTVFGLAGKNGSGKSTLLQIISGFLTPSTGKILYDNKVIDLDNLAAAYIGPYTEIIEEFTLQEFLNFHGQFKNALINMQEMAERASLPLDQSINDFSTGMKQRAKLITAFFYDNKVIFMDEPTANLDQEGFDWWQKEVKNCANTIVIASNQLNELELCVNRINL